MCLMTCYIDIITCQEALGKPYIVVRDVPSRRRELISSRKYYRHCGKHPCFVSSSCSYVLVAMLFLVASFDHDCHEKLGLNGSLRLVSHMLTKTLGLIDEDIVSWLGFVRERHKNSLFLLQFDCIMTTTKTQCCVMKLLE